MHSSLLSHLIFWLLLLIFFFNFAGLHYDWYHMFWWYDIPLHIAGGAWVALAAIYVLEKYYFPGRHVSGFAKILIILTSVLAVGVLWEIFEYSMDVFKFQKYTFATVPLDVRTDSAYDLVNDFIGAVLALGLLWWVQSRKTAGERLS